VILQDKRLEEAVAIYGEKDWVAVATYVGGGVNNERCVHRWNYYVSPKAKAMKVGEWTDEEVVNA